MKYTVTGKAVELGIGQQLKLSAAQIDARRHVLDIDDEKKGEVTSTGIVTFKKGEVITLKENFDDLPRSLSDVLTPSSKVAVDDKQKPPGSKKKTESQQKSGNAADDDLDAIEDRLENAEKALKAALEARNISIEKDLTAEQEELVKAEIEELKAAKQAYDDAVGD